MNLFLAIKQKAGHVPVFCLLLCALIVPVMTLYVLVVSHWHGPFRDMWEIFPFLQKIMDGTWAFADLWESYGYSHRLFIPRLLFIVDYTFSNANNHLLIFVSIVCQILICFIFSRIIFRDNTLSAAYKMAFIAMVVCFQFSSTLLFNFMHTFDVQWFLSCLFVTGAFYCLSIKDSSATLFLVSALFIVAACLNNFAGMAAWPIWLILVFLNIKNTRLTIMLTALPVVFSVFYLSGVHAAVNDQTYAIGMFKKIAYIFLIYPSQYFINPLVDSDYLPLTSFFSRALVLMLLLPAFILVRFWWRFLVVLHERDMKSLSFFMACIALFCYGVALMTAIGRAYDPNNAYALRYQNIVMLFWAAVIPLITLETQSFNGRLKVFLRTIAALFFVAFMACQITGWKQNLWLGYQVNRAHLALMMGYSRDVPMIAPTVSRFMIYVPGYNLEKERALHEQARKGIYSGDMAESWLHGVSLEDISQQCEGVSWRITEQITPYTRYFDFTVTGSLADYSNALMVSPNGKVVAAAIPEVKGYQRDGRLRGFSTVKTDDLTLVLLPKKRGDNRCKSH